MAQRIRFVVTGRVQGVGYRWFVVGAAQDLGLTGWVRNSDDGSVEGEAQGEPAAIGSLTRRLRTGHPGARVEGLKETVLPEKAGEKDFRIER